MKRIRFHSTSNPAVKVSKVIRDRNGRELQVRVNTELAFASIITINDNMELFSMEGASMAQIQKVIKNQLRTMGVEFESEMRAERAGTDD